MRRWCPGKIRRNRQQSDCKDTTRKKNRESNVGGSHHIRSLKPTTKHVQDNIATALYDVLERTTNEGNTQLHSAKRETGKKRPEKRERESRSQMLNQRDAERPGGTFVHRCIFDNDPLGKIGRHRNLLQSHEEGSDQAAFSAAAWPKDQDVRVRWDVGVQGIVIDLARRRTEQGCWIFPLHIVPVCWCARCRNVSDRFTPPLLSTPCLRRVSNNFVQADLSWSPNWQDVPHCIRKVTTHSGSHGEDMQETHDTHAPSVRRSQTKCLTLCSRKQHVGPHCLLSEPVVHHVHALERTP